MELTDLLSDRDCLIQLAKKWLGQYSDDFDFEPETSVTWACIKHKWFYEPNTIKPTSCNFVLRHDNTNIINIRDSSFSLNVEIDLQNPEIDHIRSLIVSTINKWDARQ